MNLKKQFYKLGVCFTLLLSVNQTPFLAIGEAMDPPSLASQFREQGHSFEKITTYQAVLDKVNDLIAQGLHLYHDSIIVLTDWDNTINGPGAWSQKDYQGKYLFETKRMLTEEEVDHRLRDPLTLEVLNKLTSLSIPIFVATARPPVRDLDIIIKFKEGQNLDLLDCRHPDNPDVMHYEKIRGIINDYVHGLSEETLLEKALQKVQIMEERSGVKITAQKGIKKEGEIITIDNHKVVYHNGFIFTGYNKGPALFNSLGFKDSIRDVHIIIVDDCERALKSFIPVLKNFTEKRARLHILHYPIG